MEVLRLIDSFVDRRVVGLPRCQHSPLKKACCLVLLRLIRHIYELQNTVILNNVLHVQFHISPMNETLIL